VGRWVGHRLSGFAPVKHFCRRLSRPSFPLPRYTGILDDIGKSRYELSALPSNRLDCFFSITKA
jgi:hypothetical protein